MMEGIATEICKGDKIKVVKGDLTGINATVTGIEKEQGFVRCIPTNYPGFNEEMRVEANTIVKYFEAGDHVRILDGKHKGETGIVVGSEQNQYGSFASVNLSQSRKEIKINTNNLKLKSEIDQSAEPTSTAALLLDKVQSNQYKAGELIFFGQNSFGVILEVDSNRGSGMDFVRVIDD